MAERVAVQCLGCGQPFTVSASQAARGRGKYCSVACRPDHPRDSVDFTCAHCGKVGQLKPSRIRAGAGTYCSRQCQADARRKPKPPKQLHLPSVPHLRQCARCGKEYRGKGTKSRYCSKACFAVPKVSGICRGCGKAIAFYPDRPTAFCSNACHLSSYPPSQQAERDSSKVRAWRAKVLRRDAHTCQHCGARDRPLNAHHIAEWATHPHLRTVLSNGLTLCDACHFALHHPELANPYAA